ncbi:hypothetical protein ACLOJK_026466 [Asimina triloba]
MPRLASPEDSETTWAADPLNFLHRPDPLTTFGYLAAPLTWKMRPHLADIWGYYLRVVIR